MKTEHKDIEIDLLLEAIFRRYGYDFRNYCRGSIERRFLHRLAESGQDSISAMQHSLLYDPLFFQALLLDLSINVTEMFRDASFYKTFRTRLIPYLKAYPYIRIWVAGCATGEEVYSIAITLFEEGVFEHTQIYATDINAEALKKAKDGIYSLQNIKEYTWNYQNAGGLKSFSDYYTAKYDAAVMQPFLKDRIVFATHNLASDAKFNEMHLISCRNVMIYFNKTLKKRVLRLFHESLCHAGLLCLGSKENIPASEYENKFAQMMQDEKIYPKKGL